ncbi:transposase [Blastopirellula sp. JC732]|uniref:Transposase n=1 Tax=Blastopirellula sediminis TaxID=2894196 RepID=A0A9X1MRF3_9BACT|nr:transposase [Blastopirellula sediminis]MCC9605633.1 transposase [Blastopirellula sediminis]MCC9631067.1 transposase [Blastopirellula sediminis]
MPQSYARLWCHLVFSTKHREPLLRDVDVRARLHAYLATCLGNAKSEPQIVGGVDDHVHLLFCLSRSISLADLVIELKTSSSKWLKTLGTPYQGFYWQAGYGAFSVSESKVPDVTAYVRGQEEHHRRFDFKTEFRALCERHGIVLNEQYAWD